MWEKLDDYEMLGVRRDGRQDSVRIGDQGEYRFDKFIDTFQNLN